MSLATVHITRSPNGRIVTVTVNGHAIEGVTSFSYTERVEELPTVTLELLLAPNGFRLDVSDE
jgi:hypothetical protein